MSFYRLFILKFVFNSNRSFIWQSSKKTFKIIRNIKSINLNLLIGIERQKSLILENTINFAKGNITNNALLWGARGSGKSSLIKSIFNNISKKYSNIKLIQLNKNNINDIESIYSILEKFEKYRFIIFVDDLSFEKIDSEYKIIKSALEGGIHNQPSNIAIYITSNRRHLMTRDMIENERSSAIHTDESVEEKISLSDRFGLWIGFHNISQEVYINIIKTYGKYYKINFTEKEIKDSIKWSLQRGNMNGRTASQFIIQFAAKKNLKIEF